MSEARPASSYTAIVTQSGPWWNGWIAEVPGVNAQEKTRELLIASLRIALQEAIDMNRELAQLAAGPDYTLSQITL